ncbi:ALC-interacting protein [Quillaja saponaria]|uniref:ALC-interacting protein n=1 Tax=Quillaja saponaria TaxID=32244 RepID=A0AAD7L3P6_QUISA|nr:ALC-interacting protein [Quillaja saponaria]
MTNSDNANSGCFSGILRQLLCAGGSSASTHPVNHIAELTPIVTELDHPLEDPRKCTKAKVGVSATPGVVARLMGLDSLPNTNLVPKGTYPDSVMRSKSMNFVDYLLEFDSSQAQHHRIRTSASFREVPALLQQQQNHEVVVLYWDNPKERHRSGSKLRKSEMSFEELKQRKTQRSKNKKSMKQRITVKNEVENQGKNKKISKLKDEPRRVPSNCSRKAGYHNVSKELGNSVGASTSSRSKSPLLNRQKEVFDGPKVTRTRRNQQASKKIVSECSSESFSPVSVLDVDEFPILHKTPSSEDSGPIKMNSKWKSEAELFHSGGLEERITKNEACSIMDINGETEFYTELLVKLCRLIEKEMKESDWVKKNMFDLFESGGLEEICISMEHKVLDLLLHEVVNELVELSCEE